MTKDDWDNFNKATICHICEKKINNLDDKVKDHCHLSGMFMFYYIFNIKLFIYIYLIGKYRGAAHNSCNLNFKNPKYIPIFFHNLSGYDSHLLIKEFGFDQENITIISSNNERYISFSIKMNGLELRFLDSLL